MDKRLLLLINSYLAVVVLTFFKLVENGIDIPRTKRAWASTYIPCQKIIGDGTTFKKLDFGCQVTFPAGSVEIEFSVIGKKFGFRMEHLLAFTADDLEDYGFKSSDELAAAFNTAIRDECFEVDENRLVYLKPEYSFV